ncbi:synaptonemal complex protein 2-like [Thomomys bottae]
MPGVSEPRGSHPLHRARPALGVPSPSEHRPGGFGASSGENRSPLLPVKEDETGKAQDAFWLQSLITGALHGEGFQKIKDYLQKKDKFPQKYNHVLLHHLDRSLNKELDRNEFLHVSLLLKCLQRFFRDDLSKDQPLLTQQGLIPKISIICKSSSNEGKVQMLDFFISGLGFLVAEKTVNHLIQQQALETLNGMLNATPLHESKKLSLLEGTCHLLMDFARTMLTVGDYSQQVSLSEALYRMTTRASRNDLVHQWFEDEVFAEAFKEIKGKEFDTDIRRFLNRLNNKLGDQRRVYSFPCIAAFADECEMRKPVDENLEKFWIDFNLGSESVTFYIHNAESPLWDTVRLQKEAVFHFSITETETMKIFLVNLKKPLTISKKEVMKIEIYFDVLLDISQATTQALGEDKQVADFALFDEFTMLQCVYCLLNCSLELGVGRHGKELCEKIVDATVVMASESVKEVSDLKLLPYNTTALGMRLQHRKCEEQLGRHQEWTVRAGSGRRGRQPELSPSKGDKVKTNLSKLPEPMKIPSELASKLKKEQNERSNGDEIETEQREDSTDLVGLQDAKDDRCILTIPWNQHPETPPTKAADRSPEEVKPRSPEKLKPDTEQVTSTQVYSSNAQKASVQIQVPELDDKHEEDSAIEGDRKQERRKSVMKHLFSDDTEDSSSSPIENSWINNSKRKHQSHNFEKLLKGTVGIQNLGFVDLNVMLHKKYQKCTNHSIKYEAFIAKTYYLSQKAAMECGNKQVHNIPIKLIGNQDSLVGNTALKHKLQNVEERDASVKPKQLRMEEDTPGFPDSEGILSSSSEDEPENLNASAFVTALKTFTSKMKERQELRHRMPPPHSEKAKKAPDYPIKLLNQIFLCRLNKLETFYSSVLQEFRDLQKDIKALKLLEKEALEFWRRSSAAMKSFCDQQELRYFKQPLLSWGISMGVADSECSLLPIWGMESGVCSSFFALGRALVHSSYLNDQKDPSEISSEKNLLSQLSTAAFPKLE